MKCNKCGNLISDGLTVCPICGNNLTVTPVEPSASVAPVAPVQTPVQTAPVEPSTPVQPSIPVQAVAPEQTVQPVNAPVMPVAPEQPVQPVSAPAPQVQPVQSAPVAPQTPAVNTAPVNPTGFVANSINPNGDVNTQVDLSVFTPVVDGEKIGSIAPTVDPTIKKNKKKKIIIIAVVAIVVVILIGLGVAFYLYEFKSAQTRLENIYSSITSFTNTITNDSIEVSSGKYDIDASLSYGDNNYSISLNGKYGTDIVNKRMDYTFNFDSINIGEELLDKDLNLEFYVNDSKAYILLENFFENYIYTDFDDSSMDVFKQNDISYTTLISGLKNAYMKALTNLNSTQTIGKATIADETKKANIIKITMNEVNKNKMNRLFYTSLANNSYFLTEASKLTGTSVDDLKETFTNLANPTTDEEDDSEEVYSNDVVSSYGFDLSLDDLMEQYNISLYVYSPIFGNDLLGIKVVATNKDSNDSYTFEAIPEENGTRYIIKNGTTKLADLDYTKTETKSTADKTSDIDFNGVIYYGDQTYKFDIKANIVDNINASVDKVNVKNAINVNNLSQEQLMEIFSNVSSFGKLGVMFSDSLGSLLTNYSSGLTTEEDTDVTEADILDTTEYTDITEYSID